MGWDGMGKHGIDVALTRPIFCRPGFSGISYANKNQHAPRLNVVGRVVRVGVKSGSRSCGCPLLVLICEAVAPLELNHQRQ